MWENDLVAALVVLLTTRLFLKGKKALVLFFLTHASPGDSTLATGHSDLLDSIMEALRENWVEVFGEETLTIKNHVRSHH